MMGSKERSFWPLVGVSLEDLVPADHFYRHLHSKLDLSFVCSFECLLALYFRCYVTPSLVWHSPSDSPSQERTPVSSAFSTGGKPSQRLPSHAMPCRKAIALSVSGHAPRKSFQNEGEWSGWDTWASSCATTASSTHRGISLSAAWSRMVFVLGL